MKNVVVRLVVDLIRIRRRCVHPLVLRRGRSVMDYGMRIVVRAPRANSGHNLVKVADKFGRVVDET